MVVSLVLGLVVAAGAPANVPLDNATQVRIDVNGDLRVAPDPRATAVHIGATSKGVPTAYTLNVTRTGSRLTLRITGPRPSVLPFVGASGASYDVTYPARASLDIREYAGNVRVERPVAPVDLYDAMGNVEIVAPRSRITAECTAGNISVTQARGSIDVAADTGNVDAELASPWSGTAIRMQVSKGRLHLGVPQAFRGNFDASTGEGHVTNELATYRNGVPVFLFAQTGDVAVSKQ